MISANVLVKNKHLIQYNEESGIRTIYDAKEEIKCMK